MLSFQSSVVCVILLILFKVSMSIMLLWLFVKVFVLFLRRLL